MKNITINAKNRTIELNKGFSKIAHIYGTEEYNQLQGARRDYPNYRVVTIKQKRAAVKAAFPNLSYAFMDKYIANHDESGEKMKEYRRLRGQGESALAVDFQTVKDWFLNAARHAEPDDLQYKRITMAVKKKLEALMKHELYSLYKAGASEEIRKKACTEYLDAADIMESFRWSTEQDMNVTHGEGELMSKHTDPGEAEYNDFNYDNVDPETLKEWEEEFHRENPRDMRSYLKRFPDATPEEKKALRSWVRKGRSPYENGWYIANESGGPMDFINALRFLEDEYQEFLKDPEGYRGCPDEQPENGISPSGSSADDLPF